MPRSKSTADIPFVFSIPLIPKAIANNWDKVGQFLDQTLRSLKNQTDPDWMTVICCHERPHCRELQDSRIQVLEVPNFPVEPVKFGSNDKYRKRRHIASWLKNQGFDSTIIFGLDADDWVRHDVVGSSRNRLSFDIRGLLINSGYRIDYVFGVGELIQKGFYKGAGSCFIGLFRNTDLPDSKQDKKAVYSRIACGHHARQQQRAIKAGWEVAHIDEPWVAYLINHSESLRKMKTGGRTRFLTKRQQRLSGSDLQHTLARDFGLNPELPSPTFRNHIYIFWHFAKSFFSYFLRRKA